MALKCHYCNDFDTKGPICSTITRNSELEECVLVEGYTNYCVSFKGSVELFQTGILALRNSTKEGEVKQCMQAKTDLLQPGVSCYSYGDVRYGVALNGEVLERVSESIVGTDCYCAQTDGCNFMNKSNSLDGQWRSPADGGAVANPFSRHYSTL